MVKIDWSRFIQHFFKREGFSVEFDSDFERTEGLKSTKVTWNLKGQGFQDIRDTFKITPAQRVILQEWTDKVCKDAPDNDSRVWRIARAVNARLKYAFDKDNWQKADYWADPFTVWTKQIDDCDGYAALIFYCMKLAGIPEARRRFVCGNVEGGGHAYVLYWTEFWNRWFPVEGSFYAQEAEADFALGVPFKHGRYGTIWFSTTERFSFSKEQGFVIEVTK